MKNIKKFFGVFAVAFALISVVMPVMAQDGANTDVWVSVDTDKETYSGDDTIKESIIVHNQSGSDISDVKVSVDIPQGYKTEDGKTGKWEKTIEFVGRNDETKVEISLFKIKNTTGASGDVNAGDVGRTIIWLIMAAAGIGGIVFAVRKKKVKVLLSAALVIALAGTAIPLTGIMSVKAAQQDTTVQQKTQTAAKTIKVNGKDIKLGVTIAYTPADLSFEGYSQVWEDEFEGTELNRDDWNVETHNPGWVNNELQAYVDSDDNIYVEDGKLVLKPIQTGEGKEATYTSGRVNTQGKHDFKYGIYEARVKVPAGQGFLPAFWMMPTDENTYGQWPRCGEIDIMEVLGNDTDTAYGTIHYGNPHSESQGKYELTDGNFSEEYHVFDLEWLPGRLNWYVDGKLMHTENDWYSATENQGEITYPAPFDQQFYMILNLAVGGNWPGNPDDTTDVNSQAFYIDYVRAYQKDSYDENVTKPIKEVILRDPDATGNYVLNSTFAEAESLTDDDGWKFLTTLGGEAEAEIKNNEIVITAADNGTVDYSVQLVQPDISLKKGGTYKLSFDAYADASRSMKVDVSAPDRGYNRYLADTAVALTTTKQSFSYSFTMTDKDDANGRVEFNLGNTASTAAVHITNVRIEKTAQSDAPDTKVVLADGNYVYNGAFQEGTGRLGSWTIVNNAAGQVSVTDLEDGRRFKLVVSQDKASEDFTIGQSDLALGSEAHYVVSFDAQADAPKSIKLKVAGQEFIANLTADKKNYSFKFTTPATLADKNIVFYLGTKGTMYLDNVRIDEDTMIKNGSFNAGFSGFETFVDSSAGASKVVDSISEDNAADFDITNTGDAEWKIQLKQSNVLMEKDKWYTLTFDIKSSIDRSFQYSIQRNGAVHKTEGGGEDWTTYVQETKELTAYGQDGEYTTITQTFKMNEATDDGSIFNIALGGKSITTQHRVCIDNIVLRYATDEEIEANAPAGVTPKPANVNLLVNPQLTGDAQPWVINKLPDTVVAINAGSIKYTVNSLGVNSYDVELKQENIQLEEGCRYRVTFDVTSTATRKLKVQLQQNGGSWTSYFYNEPSLTADAPYTFSQEFTMSSATDTAALLAIDMGAIADAPTTAHDVTISNCSVVKIEE